MKAFTFRLYPTKQQTEKLEWTLDRCRELYNAALSERRDSYKSTGKGVSYYEQKRDLVEIKETIRPEYKEIHSQVLQDVLTRLEKAMKAFFRRVKDGEKPGYPRFQSKNRYDSFTYPQGGYALEGRKIILSKIGAVKIKLHRQVQGKMKTCTIKREGDYWYAIFSCEVDVCTRTPYTDEVIGIDLGVSKLATLSNGEVIENPRYYRKAEAKLAKAQQAVARKKKGSNRRKKAVKVVRKAHRKVRNQRQDYLHKHSRWLVDCYEGIVVEDIAPAHLSKRAKPKQDEATGQYLPNGASAKSSLNKSILDAGWHQFITFCQYKAACAGRVQVVKIDPKYTSQICSQCGMVVKKQLSERWHSCECGCELDRDHNAAVNIRKLGLKVLA